MSGGPIVLCHPRYNFNTKGWIRMHIIAMWLALFFLVSCAHIEQNPSPEQKDGHDTDERMFAGNPDDFRDNPHVILKGAESLFEKEAYADAAKEYARFLDIHGTHLLAPYVTWQLGESHFRRAGAVDRDIAPPRDALAAFEKIIQNWPESRYASGAQAKIRECRNSLAESSLAVGHFYYRRESYFAAVRRFEAVAANYPEASAVPEAIYYAALAYQKIGAGDLAEEKFRALLKKHPENPFSATAKNILDNPNLLAKK
jgi:outer membrane protein assembly factor BamD